MKRLHYLGFCLLWPLAAHAYKTNMSAVHMGTSLGGAYGDQVGVGKVGWDLLPQLLTASADTYSNPNTYKTPLRLGFFYRHPNFTVDTYLRYFTNYRSNWTIAGANEGAGNSRYKGVGGGIDFEMPVYAGEWLRAGLLVNGEYIKNRVEIAFNPTTGANQSLTAVSSNAIFGGGAFLDTYIGDLWSLGLRGLYSYDLGATWRAGTTSTLLGTAYTKGDKILAVSGSPAAANYSHWRVEALLRLAFY